MLLGFGVLGFGVDKVSGMGLRAYKVLGLELEG